VPGASRSATGQTLRVDGAEVSAVLRESGGLVVRVFNPSPDPATAVVERDGTPATGWTVDLVGRPQERFEAALELRPWEIATLRLDDIATKSLPGRVTRRWARPTGLPPAPPSSTMRGPGRAR
jgi:hypothetical protein